jgi:hypothetical protein
LTDILLLIYRHLLIYLSYRISSGTDIYLYICLTGSVQVQTFTYIFVLQDQFRYRHLLIYLSYRISLGTDIYLYICLTGSVQVQTFTYIFVLQDQFRYWTIWSSWVYCLVAHYGKACCKFVKMIKCFTNIIIWHLIKIYIPHFVLC